MTGGRERRDGVPGLVMTARPRPRRAALWQPGRRFGLNEALWLATLLLLGDSVLRLSMGLSQSLGFRFGWLSLADLPPALQLWLPQMPAWQDTLYGLAFLGALAGAVLVILRRAAALWVCVIAGALALIDWALLPSPPDGRAQWLQYLTFVQYFLLVGLVIWLRQRRVLV
ncbi:hypothetical protein [Maricaulis sp. CAU 1757]